MSALETIFPCASGGRDGVFTDAEGGSHFDIDDATLGFAVDPAAGVGANDAALLPRSVPAGGVGHLAHGTQSSELGGSAVSLITFWIEPPTTGAATGRFSGANHNDDYCLITHDFGDIPDGTGINFDLPTVLTNAAAIPEPSGFLLALSLTTTVLVLRGRRKRRVHEREL